MALRDDWPWDDALLVDSDGLVFVNYLTMIAADGIEGEIEAGLLAHRQIVESRLHEFSKPSREREKYRWAAEYHNYVEEEFFNAQDFKVADALSDQEKMFPRQFRRLRF